MLIVVSIMLISVIFLSKQQPINKSNEPNVWKTYKNVEYGIAFEYPATYQIVDTNDFDTSCLIKLGFKASESKYAPTASFCLSRDINSVRIVGQTMETHFDAQRKSWIFKECGGDDCLSEQALSIWGYTKANQEIVKTSTAGSQASSAYYLIPDYKRDMAAIFRVPTAFRVRCDLENNHDEQEDCYNFFGSVTHKNNIADDWLTEAYIKDSYRDYETIVKSFNFTSQIQSSCDYKGVTYKDGEGFMDSCNSCSCQGGKVACTLIACN